MVASGVKYHWGVRVVVGVLAVAGTIAGLSLARAGDYEDSYHPRVAPRYCDAYGACVGDLTLYAGTTAPAGWAVVRDGCPFQIPKGMLCIMYEGTRNTDPRNAVNDGASPYTGHGH